MSLKSIAEGRSDLLMVDPRKLEVLPGFNVRDFNPDKDPQDRELLESVKKNGVREALLIMQRDGKYVVSSGHRRYGATMRAIEEGTDIKAVPCRPAPRGYTDRQATLDMIICNQGKPLTPLEEAAVVGRLLAEQMSETEIAEQIGKTPAHVSNMKLLLNLPKTIKNRIAENKVASTLVMELARKHKGSETKLTEHVEEAIKLAEKDGKKKATKKHVKKLENANGEAPEAEPTPEIVAGEPDTDDTPNPKTRSNLKKLISQIEDLAKKAQAALPANPNDALANIEDILVLIQNEKKI